jgi:hypothetical protein
MEVTIARPGSFPRDREREERARARTGDQLPMVIQAASTGHSDPAVELAGRLRLAPKSCGPEQSASICWRR